MVKADKIFKVKFTMKFTYTLQQLTREKGKCSLLLKFSKGISFFNTQLTQNNINVLLPISF